MRGRSFRGVQTIGLLGIGVALVACPALRAADWSISPSLILGIDFDTNRTLFVTPRSSGGVAGNLLVRMDRSTEVLDLSFIPQVDFQYFTDPTVQRANDYGFTGGASWSVDTSERAVSSFSGSYQSYDFTGTPVASLQSTSYSTLGFNEGFVRSSQLEIDLGGSVGNFSSPSESGTTHSYSADIGFKRQWTERLKITGDVGANEISYGPFENRGLIFDLNLAYTTSAGSVSLAAQRNAAPSGFGVLTERDSAQFSASRALSERLNIGTAFDLYRNSSAVGAVTFDARTYVDASVSLAWRYTETLTFTAHVLGDGARTQGTPGDQHGVNVGVQALWSPNAHSISR